MAHCRRRCVIEASSDDPHSIILYCVKAIQMRVCQSQKAKTILYYWYDRSNSILWLVPLATTALIVSRPFLALGMSSVVSRWRLAYIKQENQVLQQMHTIDLITINKHIRHLNAAAFPEYSYPLLSSHHPPILFNCAWGLSAISCFTFPRLLVKTSSSQLRVLPEPSNWLDVIPTV